MNISLLQKNSFQHVKMVVSFCWLDVTWGQIINNRHSSDTFIKGAGAYIESTRKHCIAWLKFVKNISAIRAELKITTAIHFRCHSAVDVCLADVTLQFSAITTDTQFKIQCNDGNYEENVRNQDVFGH